MAETGTFVCGICFQTITYPLNDPSNQSGHAAWCGGPKPEDD